MIAQPDPRTPIIVGVAQTMADYPAPDPATLLAQTVAKAAEPTWFAAIDSLRVVGMGTRQYSDPGRLVARTLGLRGDVHTVYTGHGGHLPQSLVTHAAWDLWTERCAMIVIGGAESWRTRVRIRREGRRSGWPLQSRDDQPDEIFGGRLKMCDDAERALGFGDPLDAYPMAETAIRAHSGRSMLEQSEHVARLWSRFSEVASTNPYAAIPSARTPEEILSPEGGNRLVSHPYRKLTVANNSVDQSAALVMTTVGQAERLGIPVDSWVYPMGGGEAHDTDSFSLRDSYIESQALRAAAADALDQAGTRIEDLDHIDVYSCFPSAVQVAAQSLGLSLDRDLTVTGGLTFAGGPWNNYSTHAIAALYTKLIAQPGTTAMCTANGGLLTKHAVGVYSTTAPTTPPRAPIIQSGFQVRRMLSGQGPVRLPVIAYTIRHDRDGLPSHGFAIGEDREGERILARVDEAALLAVMDCEEAVGKTAVFDAGALRAI